jgi:hypothetical protein
LKRKKPYLCAVEEMIQIRRSEYEQLLSQQKALERSVIDTVLKNEHDVFFALKCPANIQSTNST